MSEIEITVDGRKVKAAPGTSVAAALLNAGATAFRTAGGGAPRAPLCGMGTCYECRVTIDGVPHRRACLELVRRGMVVATHG